MSNNTAAFICGIIVGIALTTVMILMPFSLLSKAQTVINECEKDLPRSQYCVVSAKVKEKEE